MFWPPGTTGTSLPSALCAINESSGIICRRRDRTKRKVNIMSRRVQQQRKISDRQRWRSPVCRHQHSISPRENYPPWCHCFPGAGSPGACGRWAGPPPPGQCPLVASSTAASTPTGPDAGPEASWFEWPPPSGSRGSATGPCDLLKTPPGLTGTFGLKAAKKQAGVMYSDKC